MHVFFDDQIFVDQEQGGISRYFTELARALGESNVPVRIFGGITRNAYLADVCQRPAITVQSLTRRDHLRINKFVARVSALWRRWDFARVRRRSSTLVYHATNYAVDPWIARRADATCLTVFDMIGEKLSAETGRSRSLAWKRRGVGLADGILCISQHTRQDFLTWFPEAQSKAAVTLLAASLPEPSTQDLSVAKANAPFLLFVGKRSGYKNGELALRSFAELSSRHPQLGMVCFGGEAFSAREEAILDPAGADSRCRRVSGNDALLAAFYSHAAALLYPSRYEGFGLPVLEAMQCGCPVVTTPCSSLPEVAGQAAVFVEPDDLASWVQAADRMLVDAGWRKHWIDAGRDQHQRFSWANTAAQTRAAYARMLAARRESGAGAAARERAFSAPSE